MNNTRNEYKYLTIYLTILLYKTVQISYDICTRLIPTGRVKLKKLGKLEFWGKKSLDNKPLLRRFDV